MTDAEVKALQEKYDALEKENRKLKESQYSALAVAAIGKTLTDAGIPFSQKVLERACAHPEIKDGKVEESWLKSVLSDFTDGHEGSVRDLGEQHRESGRESDTKKLQENMKEAFGRLNLSGVALETAVRG